MGVDTHSLNLLRYAKAKYGRLGRTATLGRLAVFLGPRAAWQWAGTTDGAYAESMLIEKFGATQVDSIDNSNYEGATIIADMNQPLPATLVAQYDTVLDFGCTEHIFDVAQSMRNVAALCKPGGMILHAVPANGFCGHGFYQFSPELFFSLYSDRNGYADTEIYLAELTDTKHWYRVAPPTDGKRINVRSSDEMYLMVLTRHIASGDNTTAHDDIQQSDYISNWATADSEPAQPHRPGRYAGLRELLTTNRFAAKLLYRAEAAISIQKARVPRRHPNCVRIDAPPD